MLVWFRSLPTFMKLITLGVLISVVTVAATLALYLLTANTGVWMPVWNNPRLAACLEERDIPYSVEGDFIIVKYQDVEDMRKECY